MSIFSKQDTKSTDTHQEHIYSKDMLDTIRQKEAGKDFGDQVRRFKEFNGYNRHLTAELIELLRQQAIQFKLEEQKQFRL